MRQNKKFGGDFWGKHFLLSRQQIRVIVSLPNGHKLREHVALVLIGRHNES